MYLAGYLVCGFIVAGVYALRVAEGQARPLPPHRAGRDARVRVAGRAGAGDRRRLGRARGRRAPAGQAGRDGRAAARPRAARRSRSAASTTSSAARCASGSRSRGCSRCWPSTTRTPTIIGLDVRAARGPPAGEHRALRVPDDGRDRHRPRGCSASSSSSTWFRKRRLPQTPWFYRAVMVAGPLSFVALIAGWITTEVGRQPWIVYEVMRTEEAVTQADGLEVGYVVLVARLPRRWASRSSGCCAASRASRRRAR